MKQPVRKRPNLLYQAIEQYKKEIAPSDSECQKATEVLVRDIHAEHFGMDVARKHALGSAPDVAVYAVSGRLIAAFDQMLTELDRQWSMSPRDTAIEVKPVADDAEIPGMRRIVQ